MKKATIVIIYGIICLVIGFFFGRLYIDSEPKLEYIKGATTTGSVSLTQFEPIKEEKPDIQYRDTGSIKYVNLPADTAAIIADRELKRTYKLTAFDNKTQGKLELFPVIQYNRLAALDYNYTPIIERQTIYKTKVWQPFISGSYSTLNYLCRYRRWGVLSQSRIGISVSKEFG
ncbi:MULTISPECIES: hypothetical protein [Dysgonomonas]|uniref:Uncharacterized protein n=1 Tax=Dysgonomonas gadei ATCC BAA-286 TaxID=742766 RepID=F5IXL8_9BACT|nr:MULTISPECIES: hypothetical protein [Dysgonomonas]EGK01687.1 hypothetical protein HMPREF9455_01835 [Dysgonomonas gadei ATCC BAA-286]MBF0648044.1 hypothetical protein [Dysgonomonas sp. GY75]